MAIRDHFRRAMRKSEDSDSSSQSDSNLTTSTTNTSQSSFTILDKPQTSITKTTSNASKRFPWGSTSDEEKAEKAAKKEQQRNEKAVQRAIARGQRVHPSLKPLTAQNLKHQEILNQFTMTFGATNYDPRCSISGVSPCCTRPPSIIEMEHTEAA